MHLSQAKKIFFFSSLFLFLVLSSPSILSLQCMKNRINLKHWKTLKQNFAFIHHNYLQTFHFSIFLISFTWKICLNSFSLSIFCLDFSQHVCTQRFHRNFNFFFFLVFVFIFLNTCSWQRLTLLFFFNLHFCLHFSHFFKLSLSWTFFFIILLKLNEKFFILFFFKERGGNKEMNKPELNSTIPNRY